MIFLTLGTMDIPFDRLVRLIDIAVGEGFIQEEVYGQIGSCQYSPKNFYYDRFLDKESFDHYFSTSDIIISHAGMGTILQAQDSNKQILVMPRLSKFEEHVNDHQLKTAKKFGKKDFIEIINEEDSPQTIANMLTTLKHKSIQNHESGNAAQILYKMLEIFNSSNTPRIVAGASSGGHLTQLLKILESCIDSTLPVSTYLTTMDIVKENLSKRGDVHILGECNRNTPSSMFRVFFRALKFAKMDKPEYVISTGALPIAFYCFWAKLMGAKIIWIDSIANTDKLSMSGKLVKRFSTLFLTQWPELENHKKKVYYAGSVI